MYLLSMVENQATAEEIVAIFFCIYYMGGSV